LPDLLGILINRVGQGFSPAKFGWSSEICLAPKNSADQGLLLRKEECKPKGLLYILWILRILIMPDKSGNYKFYNG